MEIDYPTMTVIHDRPSLLEAVIAKDVVVVNGKSYDVPDRGNLATWLVDFLQPSTRQSTSVAYSGKSLSNYEKYLLPYATDIYSHGYVRSRITYYPFDVQVSQGERSTAVRYLDYQGKETHPGLPDMSAISAAAINAAFHVTAGYSSINLVVRTMRFRVGLTAIGRYSICDFPGSPESSEIDDLATGEPFDYRILEQGNVELFLERYREICRRLWLKKAPVRGLY